MREGGGNAIPGCSCVISRHLETWWKMSSREHHYREWISDQWKGKIIIFDSSWSKVPFPMTILNSPVAQGWMQPDPPRFDMLQQHLDYSRTYTSHPDAFEGRQLQQFAICNWKSVVQGSKQENRVKLQCWHLQFVVHIFYVLNQGSLMTGFEMGWYLTTSMYLDSIYT